MRFAIGVLFASLLMVQTSLGAVLVDSGNWTGSRTTPAASGVVGNGRWAPGTEGGLKISWEITFAAGIYTYSYTFENADGSDINPDVSHWILEVSPIITDDNVSTFIFGANATVVGPQTWTPDPATPGSTLPGANGGNPNLPAALYGIKFDTGSDNVDDATYTFQSTQAPIWGDFYAKDGVGVTGSGPPGPATTAWNTGIGTDPTDSTRVFTDWIPTPDTVTTGVIPEPSSIALLGTVAGGVAYALRKRRQS